MKNNSKKTIGRKVIDNVIRWTMGLVTVGLIAVFTLVGIRREVIETYKAETLKEEIYVIHMDNEMNFMTDFDLRTEDYVKKQYKRNGSVLMYEVRNGSVRTWIELYSGVRFEISNMGWLIN